MKKKGLGEKRGKGAGGKGGNDRNAQYIPLRKKKRKFRSNIWFTRIRFQKHKQVFFTA